MENLVGRDTEKGLLINALDSNEAELVAMLGRRRVGKTFLIRQVYKDNMVFEFSGVHEATLRRQLINFSQTMKAATQSTVDITPPSTWIEALHSLQQYLVPLLSNRKCVIFFDEFPWIHTPKSGFLQAFDHFWNSWASQQPNLVVVICGSAASWMIHNVVNNRGGLHNRITRKIRLMPFNLAEVEEYLRSRAINLDHYQTLQLYMAIGGIPHYLKDIKPGESAAQIIDRICFTKDGLLKGEFKNLYQSLFNKADNHIAIIKALAKTGKGLTRKDIIATCKLSSGGTATKLLEELVESGFITPYIPFGKTFRDNIYKLTDEYSLFYLKFMEKARTTGAGTWLKISATPSWKSWSGFAFEGLCLKHAQQIKKSLGISGVLTEESGWRSVAADGEQGTQIDLLIDRRDHCINICEMKFNESDYTIDKSYAEYLRQKVQVFKERTKTRKTLLLTLITTYPVKPNSYFTGLVQNTVEMQALFQK